MHRSTRAQAHCTITDSADKFQAVLVLHIKPKIEPEQQRENTVLIQIPLELSHLFKRESSQ